MAEMPDFNIQTLANFLPPRYLCCKCLALMDQLPMGRGETWKCPVCSVEYTSGKNGTDASLYLRSRGLQLEFDNLLGHCKALAEATLAGEFGENCPPLRVLLETMSLAKHFIHFASFGISDFFIGALKLAAH